MLTFDHNYSAPELYPSEDLEAKRSYGLPVDTWGFGCLVFNMFTGVQPFME
jgi:serine/threonine protein kinase